MSQGTSIGISEGNRDELLKVQKFLEDSRNISASANDAVAHLLAFWEQNREDKGKESGPAQTRNSKTEE